MQQNPNLPKTIRIGTTGDYLPFSIYFDETNEYHGFDVDMLKWMCEEMNIIPEFVLTTWENLESDLDAGKFDVAVGGIELNERRRQKFLPSKEVIGTAKVMLILAKDEERFVTLEDLDKEGVRILVNEGGTNEEFVCLKMKHATILKTLDNLSQFAKLMEGECDAIITDYVEALYYQGFSRELLTVQLDEEFSPRFSLGYLFAKGNELLRDKVNTYIDYMLMRHPMEIALIGYVESFIKQLYGVKDEEKPEPIDYSELSKYEYLDETLNKVH